jgi:hypothetical protein
MISPRCLFLRLRANRATVKAREKDQRIRLACSNIRNVRATSWWRANQPTRTDAIECRVAFALTNWTSGSFIYAWLVASFAPLPSRRPDRAVSLVDRLACRARETATTE